MNLKSSILKIAVVIALICMLVPVIAAEDVDDSAVTESVDASTDVISEDISAADELSVDEDDDVIDDGGDDEATDGDDETTDEDEATDGDDEGEGGEEADVSYDGADGDGVADLQVSIIAPTTKVAVGDLAKFGILVYNNGPDAASNVVVRCALISGHMYILNAKASQGEFDPYSGIWYVGDLEPGEFAFLGIEGVVLSEEDLLLVATVTSDTPDPDLSNNIAFGYIDVVSAEEPAVETLPATGNPIAMALLALLSIAGVSLRRKF